MALIDTTSPLSPVQQAALEVRRQSAYLQSAMLTAHQQIYQTVWSNPNATPQEILDEIGTDAADLFIAGSKLVDIVLTQNPAALTEEQYLPKQAPTLNPDGTVTLAPAAP